MPRGGGAVIPDNGFLEGLPRLRLVQLLSAGAEQFVGRLPEGVLLCNARGAHTPSTAEWAVTATLAAQRGIPFFVREQEARAVVVGDVLLPRRCAGPRRRRR